MSDAVRHYVVVDEHMFFKIDGELAPISYPEEFQPDIDEVWRAYDDAGQPFVFYHDVRRI